MSTTRKITTERPNSIASLARRKLQLAADEADHNLRLLVGHANFLDELMEALEDLKRSNSKKTGLPVYIHAGSQLDIDDDDSDATWSDDESIKDDEEWPTEELPEPSESKDVFADSSDGTKPTLMPSPAASPELTLPGKHSTTRPTTTEVHTSLLSRQVRVSFSPMLQAIEEECIEHEIKELLNEVEASLTSTNLAEEATFEAKESFMDSADSMLMPPTIAAPLIRPRTPVLAAAA